MEPVIGIDLGTTNSVVAYWDWTSDRPIVIPNRHGHRTTPSIVSYYNGDVLVGDMARGKITVNPANTIYNSKRVIGRRMKDLRQSDIDSWPFRIVSTPEGLPRFSVDQGDGVATFISAEEIAAMILLELRDAAEAFLKRDVTKCVITVPAYFTAEQKKATEDAGNIAGLEVLAIVAEPTAAALAYGLDEKTIEGDAFRAKADVDGWHILVFDLGGGTLDVCVLRLDGRGGFAQRAVTGDSHLGGEDFDTRLSDAVEGRLREEFPHVEFNFKSRRKLRAECERVKRMLSTAHEASIDVELQGIDVTYDVTRADMEAACADLFDGCLSVVDEAIMLARLRPEDIDEVVLIGGSTRMPKTRELLAAAFPGKPLWNGINPDEAVALGAAVFAATQYIAQLDDGEFMDVETHSVAAPPPPPPPPPAPAQAPYAPSGSAAAGGKIPVVLAYGLSPQPANIGSVAPTPSAMSRNNEFVSVAPTPASGAPPSYPPHSAVSTPPSTAGAKKIVVVSGSKRPPAPATPQVAPQLSTPTAVAAAAHSSMLPAPPIAPTQPKNIVVTNVATHSLGIALAGGEIDPIIPRGTPLPARRTDKYTTQSANQAQVVIKIIEGDGGSAKTLKKFSLKVPPAPAGAPQILVTFDLSAAGILSVTAVDEATGHKHSVKVESANMDAGEREEAREKIRNKTAKKKESH